MSAKNSDLDFFNVPDPENDWAKSYQQPASDISPKISAKNNELAFFDVPDPENDWVKPEAPSVSEQLKTAPYLFAQRGAAALQSLPSSVAELYRFLAGKAQKLGEEQAQEEGREVSESEKKLTEKFVNFIPDLVKQAGEKFPSLFPTAEQAKKKIAERVKKREGIELPEKGRGAIERGAIGAGEAVPALISPATAAVKGATLGTSMLTEALDLPEGKKLIGNLTIPALTSIIESIVRKKYIPPRGQAKELYEEGKRLGMTEKQLAPILATEGQIERHGKLASGVPATRKAFEQTGEVLGNVIEEMQNRPQNTKTLPGKVQESLLEDLRSKKSSIEGRTHSLSSEEQAAVKFLDAAINDIEINGATNQKIIGTWRSINKSGSAKRDIQSIKEPLLKAIQNSDPQLAKDLQATNKLYSQYISNVKEINPNQFNAFIDAGELQELLGAVFTFQPESLGKQVLNMASLGTLRKISSKILTDPTAQSLLRNFGKAVRDGKNASALAVGTQLKNYVQKNMPEDFQDINWDELGIPD